MPAPFLIAPDVLSSLGFHSSALSWCPPTSQAATPLCSHNTCSLHLSHSIPRLTGLTVEQKALVQKLMLPLRSWTTHLINLCCSFTTCKMEIGIIPPPRVVRTKNMNQYTFYELVGSVYYVPGTVQMPVVMTVIIRAESVSYKRKGWLLEFH